MHNKRRKETPRPHWWPEPSNWSQRSSESVVFQTSHYTFRSALGTQQSFLFCVISLKVRGIPQPLLDPLHPVRKLHARLVAERLSRFFDAEEYGCALRSFRHFVRNKFAVCRSRCRTFHPNAPAFSRVFQAHRATQFHAFFIAASVRGFAAASREMVCSAPHEHRFYGSHHHSGFLAAAGFDLSRVIS